MNVATIIDRQENLEALSKALTGLESSNCTEQKV